MSTLKKKITSLEKRGFKRIDIDDVSNALYEYLHDFDPSEIIDSFLDGKKHTVAGVYAEMLGAKEFVVLDGNIVRGDSRNEEFSFFEFPEPVEDDKENVLDRKSVV